MHGCEGRECMVVRGGSGGEEGGGEGVVVRRGEGRECMVVRGGSGGDGRSGGEGREWW